MDPMNEERLDYGEEEYEGTQPLQQGGNGGGSPAVWEERFMDDNDDFGDLYDDVNIGTGFTQTLEDKHEPSVPYKNAGMPVGNEDLVKGFTGRGTSQNPTMVGDRTEEDNPKSDTVYLNADRVSNFPVEYSGGHHQSNPLLKTNAPSNSIANSASGNSGFQIGPSQSSSMPLNNGVNPTFPSGSSIPPPGTGNASMASQPPVPTNQTGTVGSYPVANGATRPAPVAVDANRSTSLIVGDLHWWITDADIENAASQFGRVKEIRFFDERASGKSRGYCQVDFYDPAAAATCKEAMNGYVFNGRACVVKFASAETLREMSTSYMRRNQSQAHGNTNDGSRRNNAMNYHGGDRGRNHGRGGWNRGTNNGVQGSGGPMRGRGSIGARDMVGSNGGGPGLMGPYGQGHGSPAFGGPTGAMLHPQNMMGSGFGPSYLGRGGGAYPGFSAPAFPGTMPQFPAVNPMGPAGVAPHVNPAFLGQGMTPGVMGMMGTGGMNGNSAERRMDAGSVLTSEEQGKRKQSSSGGDSKALEYGKEEARHEREGRSHASWEDKGSRRDERDRDFERSGRDRYREERDGDRHQRQRDRGHYHDDDWDRDQTSSRPRGRSHKAHEENHRFHPRDRDYGRRRRE